MTSLAECLLAGGSYGGDGTQCPPSSEGPCGACCNSGVCTNVVSRDACQTAQGFFAGSGTVCATFPDGNFCDTGACCKQDGTCAETTTALECDMLQGNFSVGQACAAVSCTGACCLADGTCTVVTETACIVDETGAAGDYQGDGTVCTAQLCSLTGACCFPDNSCALLTRADCENTALTPPAGNGTYRGDLSVCDPIPCGPTGACCFLNGQCQITTQAECDATEGGTYQNDGVPCTPGLCGPVSGACCFNDGTCLPQTRTDCETDPMAGTYQGDFSVCTPELCIVPTGACCSAGDCQIVSGADCFLQPGTYQGNDTGCDSDGDSVSICDDQCPGTPAGQAVDANGCSCLQLDPNGDVDADGVLNCNDICPNTAAGARVDANGCACAQPMSSALDGDGDGVPDACDVCLGTPTGESVDGDGCSCSQRDLLPPTITNCPNSVTIALDGNCLFAVPDLAAEPTVTDNCTAPANLRFTTEPQDLSTLPAGDTAVVLTVTDESGNSAMCTITVTISQGDCPEPGCAPLCGMGSPFVILFTFCILLVHRAVHPSRKRKKRPGPMPS
ncbi:MAG: HYR domain-containing protein [Planctomycetota bacterium]|nr:HYR domain-containing protein [Planctomycetota bacterium]